MAAARRTGRSNRLPAGGGGNVLAVESLEPRIALAVNVGVAAQPQLPDLTVWASENYQYLYGWRIEREGGHKLLRLSNAVANIGRGPLELVGGPPTADGAHQVVFQRIYDSAGGSSDRVAGEFTYHPEHGHVHFDDFESYRLRRVTRDGGVGKIVAVGEKVSFCLLDVTKYDVAPVPGSPDSGQYASCGSMQGISVGWSDVYDAGLPGQSIDITNVPRGRYWLESVVDPDNRIAELDETNNVARIMISIGTPPPKDDFGNTFATAARLSLDAQGVVVKQGRIGQTGDVDMFRFTATRSGTYTITQSSGGMDSVLTVYDGGRRQIAANDDIGDGSLNSRVQVDLVAGRTYYVKAEAFGGGTGVYQVAIAFGDGSNVPTLRNPVRVGVKNLSHDPEHPLH